MITDQTVIYGVDVEVVHTYKYLGTVLDGTLRFRDNTDVIGKNSAATPLFTLGMHRSTFFNPDTFANEPIATRSSR